MLGARFRKLSVCIALTANSIRSSIGSLFFHGMPRFYLTTPPKSVTYVLNLLCYLCSEPAPTGPRTTVENAGHLTTDHGQQGTRNLVRRGIWQNDANRCSLSDNAFRFHPAAVELRDVLYDG